MKKLFLAPLFGDYISMVVVVKPSTEDLPTIENILTQWNVAEDVEKYVKRIANEINGKTEFNTHFWVAKENDKVLGVAGLSDPLPKIISFAKTSKPSEIKILYVDGRAQGKGVGKTLVNFLEQEAKNQRSTEIMVRTAKRYKFTAWGFYKKMGYKEAGKLRDKEKETMQVFSKLI